MADDARPSAHMPAHSGAAIAILKIDAREPAAPLAPLSTGQDADGGLAAIHSADGGNVSPPLRWTGVPGAGAYALIVEDPDAPRELPFLHWAIWNIPGGHTSLPEGIAADAHPVEPNGAVQGRNDMGLHGWFGPRPPAGHGVHRYYFQLFALDGPIEMDADSALADLVDAMKGRVIAKGEMVATFETVDDAPREDADAVGNGG